MADWNRFFFVFGFWFFLLLLLAAAAAAAVVVVVVIVVVVVVVEVVAVVVAVVVGSSFCISPSIASDSLLVSAGEAVQACNDFGFIGYYEVSAKTGTNIDDAVMFLVKSANSFHFIFSFHLISTFFHLLFFVVWV
jgi:hypothetical protein